MIFSLIIRGIRADKSRFLCAVAGIAIAVGSLFFMSSLVATNNAQAPQAAAKACAPWAAWQLDGIQIMRRGMRPPPPRNGMRPPPDGNGMRQPPDGSGMRQPPDGSEPPQRGMRPRPPNGKEPPMRHGMPDAKRGPRVHADMELSAVQTTIDYRPGGHVLQGPPMMALIAEAPAANPYQAVKLTDGRWPDTSSATPEVVCVKTSMRRFGASAPALGETLKFVGREGTMSARIVGYLEGGKLPAEFPFVFANPSAFAGLAAEKHGTARFFRSIPPHAPDSILTASSPSVIANFKADEQKRMDYATPLLLVAAFLTALTMLVNSLLLSVESNRTTLAILRTLGLTRSGVVKFVTTESLTCCAIGWSVGIALSAAAIAAYVACDPNAFPAGVAFAWSKAWATLICLPIVAFLATAFALRPALSVRAMDAAANRPRSRRFGMAITFACGFASFVAVEVWGASLMRAFVPSPEWPDAIVSILPSGVSSFDVEKLRKVNGVRRISELVPRQCTIAGRERSNALFLAAEWLPNFNFIEGCWKGADRAIREGDAVVITEMMSNAHGLHVGDTLTVVTGGRRGPGKPTSFPIVGVVDLNWHMVTSRGLVRGLNGSPGMTDGPVFCSFDTMAAIDPRTYMTDPAMSAPMTHLWVEYDPKFLAENGVFPAGRKIEAEITRLLGNPTGATVRLHARDEIADGTLAHGSDIIGQAARVPFIFLAILAIGFVAMLVAESDAKKHELRILRAVGATRMQIAMLMTSSAVKTALAGIVIGLPVGSLTGWLCTFKTGNWPGLPHWFVLPAEVVLEGAIGAIVFALIFAIPTALSLSCRKHAS